MNRSISITLAGLVFHVEENAYERLKNYLDSLRKYFETREGGNEIISDIEARIAELFQSCLSGNKTVILQEDVENVIATLGEASQMIDDEDPELQEKFSKEDFQKHQSSDRPQRKIFRNPDDKVIAGVASGLGAYFGIDSLWIRLILILLCITSFGTMVLIYFILWVSIPEATSTADKLRMKGKPVNVSNIEEAIKEEFSRLKNEFSDVMNDPEKRKKFKNNVRDVNSTLESGIVGIIALLRVLIIGFTKFMSVIVMIAVFIFLTVLIFTLFTTAGAIGGDINELMTLAFGGISGLVYLKVAVIFLILIPVISILIVSLRVVFKTAKMDGRIWGFAGVLWFLAFFTTIYFGASLAIHFRSEAAKTQELTLPNAEIKVLHISSENGDFSRRSIHLHNGISFADGDFIFDKGNFYINKNISVKVDQSEDSQYHLFMVKKSRGLSFDDALDHIQSVNNLVDMQDSSIHFSPKMMVEKGKPWRNQEIEYIIQVPIGSKIVVDNYLTDIHNNIGFETGLGGDYQGQILTMTQLGLTLEKPRTVIHHNDYTVRELGDISEVEFNFHEKLLVEIISSSRNEIEIINELASDNGLSISDRNEKLLIKYRGTTVSHPNGPHIRIYMNQLERAEFHGVVDVSIANFNQQDLEIESSGSASIAINAQLESLDLDLSGLSKVQLKGSANSFVADLSGSSDVNALEMKANTVELDLSGLCSVKVFAVELLKTDASGKSTVEFKGNPKLVSDISGLSTIQPMN